MNISELRKAISDGTIKTGGSNAPKVGSGTFNVTVTEAVFGKGQNGNPRAMFTCKVISGGTDAEVGGEFRYYVQTVNPDYLERSIAEWSAILVELGIPEDRIWQDCDTTNDIVSNIASIANKLALKGKLKLVIDRPVQMTKAGQPKLDAKGNAQYWNNIKSVIHSDPETDAVSGVAGLLANANTPVPTVPTTPTVAKPW